MLWRYEAFDGTGAALSGDLEAADEAAARERLRARGLTVYALSERARGAGERRGGRGVLPDEALARFVRGLGVLIQADVPLEAALRIEGEGAPRRLAGVSERLLSEVRAGATLAQAMRAARPRFRDEYVRIVWAGETAGDLGAALGRLADLLERRIETDRRLKAALAYPAFLTLLALLSLAVVLGLLVPAVAPIFRENGLPTPAVIAALESLRTHAGDIVVALAAASLALAGGLAFARRSPALRRRLDAAALRVPVAGPILAAREGGRFVRTLAALAAAGVAPLEALESATGVLGNASLRARLDEAARAVRSGAGLAEAIGEARALPPAAAQMLVVGDESGRLAEMLARAAALVEREEELRMARVLAVLTPATTLLVAGLVATIVLSVMSAILSINELAL
jgi:general secretion pathway protein F